MERHHETNCKRKGNDVFMSRSNQTFLTLSHVFYPRGTKSQQTHTSIANPNWLNMEIELRIAVEFLLSFVVNKFDVRGTEGFVKTLIKLLKEKFEGHWYPDHPNKGSAYRCISLCHQLDSVLIKAALETGFDVKLLEQSLPSRLDVWVDPKEVSYRIGEYGSVMQIYQQGNTELNTSSEAAIAVLKTEQTNDVEEDEKRKMDEKDPIEQKVIKEVKKLDPTSPQASRRQSPQRDINRLSPTARSFVSRRSPPLPVQVPNTQSIATTVYAPKPVNATRKPYWQPLPVYDPVASIQAHNYLVAHEMARFEAHMKAQRIALQTHYYKSPFQYVKRIPGHYHLGPVPTAVAPNNGNMRVQVVA